MKNYVITFKDSKSYPSTYYVSALTRFQALLQACRKQRASRTNVVAIIDYKYIVNLSGPAHL